MGILFRREVLKDARFSEKHVIAVVSDLHCHGKNSLRRIEKAIDGINERDVDAVFLLGDYVSNVTLDASPLKVLSRLESQSFAVLGNHDYHQTRFSPHPNLHIAFDIRSSLAHAGVRVLNNEHVRLQFGQDLVNVLGIGNMRFDGNVELTFAGVDTNLPTLVLVHDPDMMPHIDEKYRSDVVLCGHTHGFAVRLPIVGHPFPYIPGTLGRSYDKGWKNFEGRDMYITSGLGNVAVAPIRVFNPPEVVLLELAPEKSI